MVILVCGGRDFEDYVHVKRVLDEVAGGFGTTDLVIVNGGARGADGLSTRWAKERGVKVHSNPIAKNAKEREASGAMWDWESDGLYAGPKRNQFMLDTFRPDFGVVFPGGKGTKDMMLRMFEAHVPMRVTGGTW